MSRADRQHVMFTALLWLQRNFVEPKVWREDSSKLAYFVFIKKLMAKCFIYVERNGLYLNGVVSHVIKTSNLSKKYKR